MTKSRVLAVVAGGGAAVALLVAVALAQQGTKPQTRGPEIALVDMGKLFKENQRLKLRSDELTKEVTQAEEYFKGKRDTLRQKMETLKTYQAGSREYADLDRKIATDRSDLQVEVEMQEKAFAQKRAKIYYETYQEIQRLVNEYAAQAGIGTVLKFNSLPPDTNKPDDMMREVFSNPFVYYHASLDITPAIQDWMNKAYSVPNPRVSERPTGGTGGYGPMNFPQQR